MKKHVLGLFLLALAFFAPANVGQATLVTLPSPIFWPGLSSFSSSNAPSFSNTITVDAAGEYLAYVFTARENMVVSHVGFRLSAPASGSPTATVTIENLDSGGLPSGTPSFGSSAGTSATLVANTNPLVALGASATIPAGSDFAVKIAYASGTSFVLSQVGGVAFPNATAKPYLVNNTGTPTRSIMPSGALIGLGSSATTFYQVPGAIPLSSISGGTFNNTSAAKRGLRFTLPFNCRIVGIRWYNANAAGDYNALLLDDAGSTIESTPFDGDTNGVTNNGPSQVFFDTPFIGSAGTTYRAAIEPTTATNVNLSTMVLVSSSYRAASPLGTTGHYTTFTTGGGWDDSETGTVPLMDIIIDQIDNGTGAGSSGGNSIIGVQ